MFHCNIFHLQPERAFQQANGMKNSYIYSDFFVPIGTGTGTHSIGENGVKIKRIGIFYQCTCNVKLISKEEKVRTRQDALISLW